LSSNTHAIVIATVLVLAVGCGGDEGGGSSGNGGSGNGGSGNGGSGTGTSSGTGTGTEPVWGATLTGLDAIGLPVEVTGDAFSMTKAGSVAQYTGAVGAEAVTLTGSAEASSSFGLGTFPTSFSMGFTGQEFNCTSDNATITMTGLDPDVGTFEGAIVCTPYANPDDETGGSVSGFFREFP